MQLYTKMSKNTQILKLYVAKFGHQILKTPNV